MQWPWPRWRRDLGWVGRGSGLVDADDGASTRASARVRPLRPDIRATLPGRRRSRAARLAGTRRSSPS